MEVAKSTKTVVVNNLANPYKILSTLVLYLKKILIKFILTKVKKIKYNKRVLFRNNKKIKVIYNQSVNSTRQILSMSFENEIERIFNSLH